MEGPRRTEGTLTGLAQERQRGPPDRCASEGPSGPSVHLVLENVAGFPAGAAGWRLAAELPLVAWLAEMCSQARACMGVHTQARLYTWGHARTRTRTHTRTHMHAHAHTGKRCGQEAPGWREVRGSLMVTDPRPARGGSVRNPNLRAWPVSALLTNEEVGVRGGWSQ